MALSFTKLYHGAVLMVRMEECEEEMKTVFWGAGGSAGLAESAISNSDREM